MKKILFVLFAAIMGFTGAAAQDADFKTIEIAGDGQTEVELTMGINYFMLTAPQDGTLAFSMGWSSTMVYLTDENGTEDTKVLLAKTVDLDKGNIYTIDVKEGQLYYFSTSIVVDPVTMTVGYGVIDNSIKLSSNYEDGQVFNLNGSNLELVFDRQVAIERTLVAYGDGKDEDIPTSCINAIYAAGQYYYTIMLRDLVEYLMDGGKIAVGGKFTVRLEGIADANNPEEIYGDDGSYEITLEVGDMPATLLSIDPADGSNIYTYYPEDGDDGFITFTFSDPLNEDKAGVLATLSWGDQEAGSFEQHYPDFTIEGNTVTVDIRGIMIPEETEGSRGTSGATTVTLSISGLTTADGRSVDPNYPEAGRNAILAFYHVTKQEISFIYDFYPQSGNASLEGYDEIMIWLNNPVMYDGVTITWYDVRGTQHSRTYTPEEVAFEWDDYEDGYVAYVSLRNIRVNNQPVTVTVDNARLMNGDPVTITGTFNTDATGIDNATVGADPSAKVKVYSLDGRFVREAAAADAVDGLAKGVYIVGGKKLMVK